MSQDRYEHFSRGDRVFVTRVTRSPVSISGPSAFKDWISHDPQGGEVRSMTNAGFRGLEYSVLLNDGTEVHGVSPVNIALVEAAPLRPWPTTNTYRNGARIEAAR